MIQFNKEGKLIAKIEQNTGPVIFNFINDALIDSNELKLLIDSRILSYDKNNFRYLYSKQLSYPALGFEHNSFSNGYLFYLGFQTLSSRKLVLYADEKYTETKREINAINRETIVFDNYFIKQDQNVLFYQPFYPILYNLNNKNKYFKIKFDEGNLSMNEVEVLIKSNDINSSISRNPSSAIVSHYIVGGYDHLLFLYHINIKKYLCVYNFLRDKSRVIPLDDFTNDISFEPAFPVVVAIDKEGYFYAYYESSSFMHDDTSQNDSQYSPYSTKLKDLIKSNPKSSILIKFKLKNELFL